MAKLARAKLKRSKFVIIENFGLPIYAYLNHEKSTLASFTTLGFIRSAAGIFSHLFSSTFIL
ncbi:hypothetical protein A4S05_21750 [Nostoc sp. KVJ20]|uniref:hypothetical protein n=1 Tax=Nostoc sp. KVJ20 TaxID=457944 RepID=UPI00083E23B8|nr:hypothetical protein [Nostoc sp. KVJ20]ODH02963.1 hypothetical protein A4S05_21750 [Nostoc sp. KVJ20]